MEDLLEDVVDINRYLVNPFDDDIVKGNDGDNVTLLNINQKKDLINRLHGFKVQSGSEAALRQGYSTDDAPELTENGVVKKLQMTNSHQYPFTNDTMKTKVVAYWALVNP